LSHELTGILQLALSCQFRIIDIEQLQPIEIDNSGANRFHPQLGTDQASLGVPFGIGQAAFEGLRPRAQLHDQINIRFGRRFVV
jgi:hypothetical protein